MNEEGLDLAEVKSQLDSLGLELLRGRFSNVDVERYFRVSDDVVEELKRRDRKYRTEMEWDDALGTLIAFAMDKLQGAYMMISGELPEEKADRLLKDYEIMIGDYLQSLGHLREY